ncbi:MAG: hypothetical protein WC690_09055 [bacterium]
MKRLLTSIIIIVTIGLCAACGDSGVSSAIQTQDTQPDSSTPFGIEDGSDSSGGATDVSEGSTGSASSGTSANKTVAFVTQKSSVKKEATVGVEYKQKFTAKDASDYVWSVAGMPKGLDLVPDTKYPQRAMISGTPEEAGNFSIDVSVKDAEDESRSATLPYTLKVKAGKNGIIGVLPNVEVLPVPALESTTCNGKKPVIEVVNNGNYKENLEVVTVLLGGLNENLKLQVKGGKGPYTWTWKSKVITTKDSNPENVTWTPVGDGGPEFAGQPANIAFCNGFKEIATQLACLSKVLTAIASRKAETKDTILHLSGAYRYGDALLPQDPQEELVVQVTDSCSTTSDPKKITFKLQYPAEKLEDLMIRLDFPSVNAMWNTIGLYVKILFLKQTVLTPGPRQNPEPHLLGTCSSTDALNEWNAHALDWIKEEIPNNLIIGDALIDIEALYQQLGSPSIDDISYTNAVSSLKVYNEQLNLAAGIKQIVITGSHCTQIFGVALESNYRTSSYINALPQDTQNCSNSIYVLNVGDKEGANQIIFKKKAAPDYRGLPALQRLRESGFLIGPEAAAALVKWENQ